MVRSLTLVSPTASENPSLVRALLDSGLVSQPTTSVLDPTPLLPFWQLNNTENFWELENERVNATKNSGDVYKKDLRCDKIHEVYIRS
jgi:hypothetical protein